MVRSNSSLPSLYVYKQWLYLTLAAIILGCTAYKTYKKFWDARRKEQAKREAEAEAAAKSDAPEGSEGGSAEQNSIGETADEEHVEVTTDEVEADDHVDNAEVEATREKLLQLDSRQ